MSHMDNSVNNQEYEERIEKQTEKLKKEFSQIDKNGDDKIDEQELSDFLTQKGKNINKETLAKLFKTLDFDQDGSISVNEFIKMYLKNLSELEVYLHELKGKIQDSNEESQRLEQELKKYQNEKRNQYGVSEEACVITTIEEIVNESAKSPYQNIELKMYIKYEDENLDRQVNSFNNPIYIKNPQKLESKFIFNKMIQENIKSKEASVMIEIYDKNTEIGRSEVPLSSLNNQQAYDLDLEITDAENNDLILTVKTKFTFIWSHKLKYQDELKQSKKREEKSLEIYNKTKNILDNLDEPFNLMSIEIDKANKPSGIKTSQKEYEYADMVENKVKGVLKLDKVNYLPFIKILLYISVGLAFINMFTRADFINLLIPVYILAILSSNFKKNSLENLILFTYAAGITLITDLLWLFFRSSSNTSDAGGEDSIRSFVYFTSLISFFVKVFLVIALWILRLKVQRGYREE